MANIYDSPNPFNADQESGSGERCPFLGVRADPSTCLGYPSLGNLCHRVRHPESVAIEHQECFCLTEEHPTCPVFSASAASPLVERLPQGISTREQKSSITLNRSTYGWVGGIFAGLVLLGLLFMWTSQSSARHPDSEGSTSGQTSLSSLVTSSPDLAAAALPSATPSPLPPSATPSPSPTATQSPTPTASPTSTSTPTLAPPTPGPAFETPFGPSGRYLLHRVTPGEGLINLARSHGTTADVIRFTNHILPGYPLYPDLILVIQPGQTELEGLQKLRAVLLEAPLTIDELADQEGVSVEEIVELNSLGPHTIIPAGRWLILPRNVDSGGS